jgi:hypothetical protein
MASTKIYKVTGFDKVIFNGVELNQVPPTLEDCRWDEIQDIVRSGKLGDYFSLDSRKNIKLTSGETITMRLVSINDGTGSYGQYYPAHTADFVSYNTLDNYSNMARWNSQLEFSKTNWASSEVRQKLNQKVYDLLPADVKSIIVEKRHQYVSTINYNTYNKQICSDKIWLPTAAEMSGGSFSYSGETNEYNKRYIPLESNRSIYYAKRITSSEGPASDYNGNFSGLNIMVDANKTNLSGQSGYVDNSKLPVAIGFRIG